jgi:hypothetical protein
LALCVFSAAGVVSAQDLAPVGRDAGGLPGIDRVGIWTNDGRSVAVSGTAGYGYTEPITSNDNAHNRGVGRIGFAIVPMTSLQLSLRFDGRFDAHGVDEEGKDTGLVGEPWLVARSGSQLSDTFALGAELGAWFPGSDAPSVEFAATTVEAKLLGGMSQPGTPWLVAAMAGFRLDQSAQAVGDADLLRRGDRVALGASDFNAMLLGLGLDYRRADSEIVAELSADILLGVNRLSDSPMRATAGYRHHINDALQLAAHLTGSLSSRPSIGPGSSLIPIEPRLLASAGLTYTFDLDQAPPSARETGTRPIEEPPIPKAESAPVSGIITDETGKPLGQVSVSLRSTAGETQQVLTDESGRYQFQSAKFGDVKIQAITADYAPGELSFALAGDGAQVEVPALSLRLAVLNAQVQGLVRSFGGAPLTATIRIEPPGTDYKSSSDGRFAIDVQPGTFTVTIEAAGYEPQTRTVLVPEKGVIVFNADLRERR